MKIINKNVVKFLKYHLHFFSNFPFHFSAILQKEAFGWRKIIAKAIKKIFIVDISRRNFTFKLHTHTRYGLFYGIHIENLKVKVARFPSFRIKSEKGKTIKQFNWKT